MRSSLNFASENMFVPSQRKHVSHRRCAWRICCVYRPLGHLQAVQMSRDARFGHSYTSRRQDAWAKAPSKHVLLLLLVLITMTAAAAGIYSCFSCWHGHPTNPAPVRSISPLCSTQNASQLRVFVAQASGYQYGAELQDRYGFAALGQVLDIDNNLWSSNYEYQDSWWINQMNISLLQVIDAAEADILFVAARFDTCRPNVSEEVRRFMASAHESYPYLGQKPHVIALNNPFGVYTSYVSTIQSMPQSELFTFVTIEAYSNNNYSSTNWVTAPYMAHIHWHQGFPALPSSTF